MRQDCVIGRIAILGAVGGELADISVDLLEQRLHLRGIALVLICQAVGNDLTTVGIERQMQFPLSLRMVEDMLSARGIIVSHETVRRWAEKFGRDFAGRIRPRAPQFGDKWHLDEVVLTINGQKHRLWRAVDQDGFVLDALVQGGAISGR